MKKYSIIYADPPWQVKRGSPNLHKKNQGNRDLEYPTMGVDEIKSLPVKKLSDSNCVLFLWTINKYLKQSYEVAEEWGFKPSTMIVWCKKPKGRGLGGTFASATEYLLFCVKGKANAKNRMWSNWFEHKRLRHSEKPEMFRDMIEKCFDGNKIELFARKKTIGWDSWGDEVESDIEIT